MVRDKLGQSSSVGFIIAVVILAVFAVVVIYGIYMTNEKFIDVFNQVPDSLTFKLEFCNAAINNQAFCQYTPVVLDNGIFTKGLLYLNCEYPGVEFQNELENSGVDYECSDTSEKDFCAKISEVDGFKGATINGDYCNADGTFEDRTSEDNTSEEIEENDLVAIGGECDEDEGIFCEDGLTCSVSGICQPEE